MLAPANMAGCLKRVLHQHLKVRTFSTNTSAHNLLDEKNILIDIGVTTLLDLVCLLMRIMASLLCYSGFLKS